MSRRCRSAAGQALIEYAILVSAAVLGISVIVNLTYKTLVDHSQTIERDEMIF